MAKKEKEPLVATHAVFYTDGGCRPSRGIGGYGVHGYTFTLDVPKFGTGCKNAIPSKEGYIMDKTGIPDITLVEYIDAVGSIIPESTNNVAELTALLHTFEIILDSEIKNALILMDSNYVRDGIEEYLKRWEANNWVKSDGFPVANEVLWKRLSELKKELEAKEVVLKFGWIKGHSGNLGNEIADNWATKGIAAGRNNIELNEIIHRSAKGYWNTKPEVNRLFSQSSWYFNSKGNSLNPDTGCYSYYLGEPREDDELLGGKVTDASFSVLQMKEADPILELVRGTHAETDQHHFGNPVLGKLDKIFSKDVLEDLVHFGNRFIKRDRYNGMLFAVGSTDPMGIPLTRELRPPRLAFAAMESLEALEEILNKHVRKEKDTKQLSTEITALIYETVTQGKKDIFRLKPDITTSTKVLRVKAPYRKSGDSTGELAFDLTFGHDLPDRNTFSAIVDHSPRVYVVTWPESAQAIRYATIVETDNGRGIWAALYSNLLLIPPTKPKA